MSLVLRIEQPGRLPLFLAYVHRDGTVSVTFHPAEARRFARPSPSVQRRINQRAAAWPERGHVTYVATPV